MTVWRQLRSMVDQPRWWSALMYAITWLAIALGPLTPQALSRGSGWTWLYLLGALGLMVRGVAMGRRALAAHGWLWLLLSSLAAVVALTGGLHSPVYPLIYLFWVGAPAWLSPARRLGAMALGFLGLQLAMAWAIPPVATELMFVQLGYCLLFVGTHRLIFGGYVKWLREDQRRLVDEQKLAFERDARDFRLGRRGQPGAQAAQAERGAVASVRGTLHFELDLLVRAVGVHSALLLWPEAQGEQGAWTIKAGRSPVQLAQDRVLHTSGLLAPLLRGEPVLRINGALSPHHRFYYEDQLTPVTTLCAVAVLQGSRVEGVLLVDRLEARSFEDAEVQVLQRAAEHLARCVAQERAFAQIERQRRDHAQLFSASALLNQALGMAQVQRSALEALSLLLPNDLALLFATDDLQGPDPELCVRAQRLGRDAGPSLDPDWQASVQAWTTDPRRQSKAGMVGAARKNNVVVVPKHLDPRAEPLRLFGEHDAIAKVGSVAVFPLSHAEQCGAVAVLLSHASGAFDPHALSLARILVHQVGAALQNAGLYDQMQRQATTDGLTGLANHRTFQTRLEQAIAHSERSGQPLSIILADIDHFKQVNDRYGHPVGDHVLREVAAVLAELARKNDVVARYGGEEFVVLLPGSDAQAAEHLAQRLRSEVEQRLMQAKDASFYVTLSLGIAQWGTDAETRQQLIDRADQALYACKGAGRNCVRLWRQLEGARAAQAAS